MRPSGQRQFPRGVPRWPDSVIGRLALVTALLVVAAVGSRAREVTHLTATGMLTAAAGQVATVVGVVLIVAACLLLIVMIAALARRKRPDDEFQQVTERPGTWWTRALILLAVLVLLALPVAALVAIFRGRRGSHGVKPAPAPLVPAVPHLHAGTAPAPVGTPVLLAAVLAVVLAAVAVLVFTMWRRRRAIPAPRRPAREPSPLAAAVAAGRAALADPANARDAIIACYEAMEDALAAAGSPRRAADTPEDFLTRVSGQGLVTTPAAQRLTALFREARYSPHDLAGTHRQQARAALDDLSRELEPLS